MKKSAVVLALAIASLLFTVALSAQESTAGSPTAPAGPSLMGEADKAWQNVQAAAFRPDFSRQLPATAEARQAALLEHARVFVRAADMAKDFYTQYPGHAKAGQAKLVEVRTLVAAVQTGDATVEGRLASAVETSRRDPSITPALRVQMVSAYSFPKAMRTAKDRAGRLAEAVAVARSLAVEFPDQPQGVDSLINLAAAVEEAAGRQLLEEVLGLPQASAVQKQRAQSWLARYDLVGKPLAAEFEGAGSDAGRQALTAGRPTILYTWASWSPGSLRLAADLKKMNPAANLVGLNLDRDGDTARALAEQEGLPGRLIYDSRGVEGALAQRLKVRGAPEVILSDAQGLIRDVRGEDGLSSKLQALGL